jgi:hypothetical protein
MAVGANCQFALRERRVRREVNGNFFDSLMERPYTNQQCCNWMPRVTVHTRLFLMVRTRAAMNVTSLAHRAPVSAVATTP